MLTKVIRNMLTKVIMHADKGDKKQTHADKVIIHADTAKCIYIACHSVDRHGFVRCRVRIMLTVVLLIG